jgi:hypothetical protein
MHAPRAGFLIVCLLGLPLACTAPEQTPRPTIEPVPKPPDSAIKTDQSRYAFRYGSYGPEVVIVTTFQPKEQTAYVINCNGAISTGLQRLVGGAWLNAWGAATNACLSQPIVIAPGEQHTDSITIVPGAGAVIYPRDRREIIEPGTYRAIWHNVLTSFDMNARPFGEDMPVGQRVSAPFVIDPAPNRPALITSFEPAAGAFVARDVIVRITFDFRLSPRSSPGSLRLFIDGKDVTDQARMAATEDVPPSHVELLFAPKEGWVPGRHGVKVEIDGPPTSYSWQFIVSADD